MGTLLATTSRIIFDQRSLTSMVYEAEGRSGDATLQLHLRRINETRLATGELRCFSDFCITRQMSNVLRERVL